MPQVQITEGGSKFEAVFSSDELSQSIVGGGQLINVCDFILSYPNNGYVELLPDEVLDGIELGDVSFSIEEDVEQFELVNGQLIDSISLTNKLSLQTEYTFVENTFTPCDLDRDQNGVVSQGDVNAIYNQYVGTTNSTYDLDNSGLVTENDRELALQYINTLCAPTDDPPLQELVLDLDCFNFVPGENMWPDASGREYHFNLIQSRQPTIRPDGAIKCGWYYDDADEGVRAHGFFRLSTIYEDDNVPLEDKILTLKEDYIPDTDEDFSFEVVFKMSQDESNALDITGMVGPPQGIPNLSHPASATWLGYQLYQDGGWHFGTFLDGSTMSTLRQYALYPDDIVPYRGWTFRSHRGDSGDPPAYVSNQGIGMSTSNNHTLPVLGLNFEGFNIFNTYCIVQCVVKGNTFKMYWNGELVENKTDFGIARPNNTKNFVIGGTTGGGVNLIKGVDIYMFRAYNYGLQEEQIHYNREQYTFKYFGS